MTRARKHLASLDETPYFHVVSRIVRPLMAISDGDDQTPATRHGATLPIGEMYYVQLVDLSGRESETALRMDNA